MTESSPRRPAATPIEPAQFSTAATVPHRPVLRRSPLVLGAVTVALAGAVLFVVLILPQLVAPAPRTGAVGDAAPASAGRTSGDAPGPAAAGGALDETQRKATQEGLAAALDALDETLGKDAENWARRDIHDIRARIAEGEKAYREQRYDAAGEHYRAARQQAEAVQARVPARIAALVDEGRLALASGDSAAAAAAFDAVLALEADHAAAAAGRARAQSLDRVLALIGQAEGYERMGDQDQALATYREALALDDAAPGAATAVQRLERARRATQFRQAMARGLEAIEKADFKTARAALERAAALNQAPAEVNAALAHLDNAETAALIDRHLGAARAAVRQERWAEAIPHYDAALAIDTNLVAARSGRATAVERAELDRLLASHLERPDRLTDDAVHDEASALLARARASGASGARFERQLDDLERALRLARTPIGVTLRSDAATQVTLLRVAPLGQFNERRLELEPGSYVAVGRRDGYRDVRVEFSLRHGDSPTIVTVACQERIALGS
ncbi:MAG: hypothetical protein WD928_03810 [Gammaproteobacteria bacterium]